MKPRSTTHELLRKEIMASDYNQRQIALLLGVSYPAFCQKMNGTIPWKLFEAYKIRSILKTETPIEALFPPKEQTVITRR